MLLTDNAVLVNCGRQETVGEVRLLGSRGDVDCLLLVFFGKGAVKLNGMPHTVHPYTYLLYPFDGQRMTVSVPTVTPIFWAHLRFTQADYQMLPACGLTPKREHPLVQPLSIPEIQRLLLSVNGRSDALSMQIRTHALGLLLSLLMQNSDTAAEKAVSVPHYDKLTELRRDIYLHPSESWYIQDICEKLCISKPYFHKIYLSAFGITCTQDVILSRIAYSKKLLKETDLAISEVSQKCGFETDVYFMRQFKRHTEMTPTAYRRLCRQDALPPDASDDAAGNKESLQRSYLRR